MTNPKVSFFIINCNRLFYLKSCLFSLLETTKDFLEKEVVVIDNCSVEQGTKEFLNEQEQNGVRIIRQNERDYSNEFAKALNVAAKEFKGDFLVPLQGDQQFCVNGRWLKEYVSFYEQNINNIGCITLDAQRRITNSSHQYSELYGEDYKFVIDYNRFPISGAGDVFYSRKVIEMIFPWNEENLAHEGGNDSETFMLKKVKKLLEEYDTKLFCACPTVPPAITIYNENGTNGRIRKNKRYGKYWPAKTNFKYYEINDCNKLLEKFSKNETPISIEDLAEPIGWNPAKDQFGNWLKKPIIPAEAKPEDYSIIDNSIEPEEIKKTQDEEYLSEWLK